MASPGVIDLLPAPQGAGPFACAGGDSDPLDLWLGGSGGDVDLSPANWTMPESGHGAEAAGLPDIVSGRAMAGPAAAPDFEDGLIDLMLAQGISVQTLLQGGDAYIVFGAAHGHSFDMAIRLSEAPVVPDLDFLAA
jgi:hypothetical protein